jgi:hypothetical protein
VKKVVLSVKKQNKFTTIGTATVLLKIYSEGCKL